MIQYGRKERREFTKKHMRTKNRNTTTAPHKNSLLIAIPYYNLSEPYCNGDAGGIVDNLGHGGHDYQVRHYIFLSVFSSRSDTVRGALCRCIALRGNICAGACIRGGGGGGGSYGAVGKEGRG